MRAVGGDSDVGISQDRSCHEGIPFADGKTGVLVWGGGDTVNITVGRGDLWDHRGGYPWTDGQSYTNIISLVGKGDAAALKSLFSAPVPEGGIQAAIRSRLVTIPICYRWGA